MTDHPQDQEQAPPQTQELARRPVTHEVLLPLDVGAQAAAMASYQQGLRSILDDGDWQNAGRGERFVKKSGWRKIAAWFNLSIELVRDGVDRAEDGSAQRAQVIARATAPNGRYADGDGYCDVSESRFDRNKAKLENDLRGTATTRAVNRAISNLVGLGAVSHEEAQASGTLPHGPEASEPLATALVKALAFLYDTGDGPDETLAGQAFAKIGDKYGYIPAPVAWSIGTAAGALRESITSGAEPVQTEAAARADREGAIAVAEAALEEMVDEVVSKEPEPVDAEVVPDDAVPRATDDEERRVQAALADSF